MNWFRHRRLHRDIKRAAEPWAPGERHTCWICGLSWQASTTVPIYLKVEKLANRKAPRP